METETELAAASQSRREERGSTSWTVLPGRGSRRGWAGPLPEGRTKDGSLAWV